MKISFLQSTDAWVISLVLFLLMLVSTWLGLMVGQKRKNYFIKKGIEISQSDTTYLTGLLFFLLAFTFGMSGSRYDARRVIIVEEANDIGTALLRADMYPPEERELFRKDFKEYVEARINFYTAGIDIPKVLEADSLTKVIGNRIWLRAAELSRDPANTNATRQMIPALNTMIDVVTTRIATEKAKVPESIVWMLFALACISLFYSGYSSAMKGKEDWLVFAGLCLLIAMTVYFTLDLDRPRRGFLTLDGANQFIIQLRENFK